MRFVLRKFVEATTVQEAVRKDRKTPVHDCHLEEGERPSADRLESAIGFSLPPSEGAPFEMRRKR